MPKSAEYRSSAVQFDGAMPVLFTTSDVTFATTAVANISPQLVPFDAYIEKMWVKVETTSTATGTRTIDVGTATDDNKFIAATVVSDANIATRQLIEVDLTATDGTIPDRSIPAGSRIEANLNIGTAGGVVSMALLLSPNAE